jgi:hypothetical protein
LKTGDGAQNPFKYVRIVRESAEYFHQSPDKLGPEQVRQYQAHLFQSKKLAPATVSQYVSALRFWFIKTLRRHFLAEHIPFPKSHKRLPTVHQATISVAVLDSTGKVVMESILETNAATMDELQNAASFGFEDGFHDQLSTAIQDGDHYRFLVHVHADIIDVATLCSCLLRGEGYSS